MGVTKYAADELTDITYVELKDAGDVVSTGEPVGEVESVKTTSDVYSAVEGEIVEVNQAVIDDPSLVNSASYSDGWLVKIKTGDASPLDALMNASAYDEKYPVG